MIKAAKEAGANCVKFQKRNPDKCVPENQKNLPRKFLGQEMTYLEYKKKIEFDEEDYDKINDYCNQIGIQWTASVWDIDSFNFMKKYFNNIPFIKIPSACITDLELLNEIAKTIIPVIMSNGMSTQKEVDVAIKHLPNLIGLMHCNSSYPANENELDLNVIKEYIKKYPQLKIGYSGHEEGYFPTLIASSLGINLIERHFTLDNELEGTDQKASLEPDDFKEMIEQIYRIQIILGNNKLKIYPNEQKIKNKLRKI